MNSIRRRILSASSSQGLLPNEYQQVEYIESTGTQYIDLGISISKILDFDVYVKYEISEGALFGTSNLGSGHPSYLAINDLNFFREPLTDASLSDEFSAEISAGSGTRTANFNVYKNGALVNSYADVGNCWTTGIANTLCLFKAVVVWWSELANTYAKLAYFKIYDRTIQDILLEMYPCYRKADNEVGMYDIKNGVFYTNSGTGSFIKGQDV